MKKNLFFAAILCIGLLAVINSCVKDTFTEQDAYSEQRKTALQQDSIAKSQMEFEAQLAQEQALLLDSLKNVGGTINYSVAVVSASESSWWSSYYAWWWDKSGKGEKSETGVSAATVTIAQHGRIFTATTGTDGIASFNDLRVGTANVNITVSGYTTVDYVVELPPLTEGFHSFVADYYDGSYTIDSTTNKPVDLVRHVATMVPVFSLTSNLSTVTGVATVETDLTNNTPEIAAGVKIMGIIDVMDENFWSRYIYHPDVIEWWNCSTCELRKQFDYYGTIKQIAFGSTISSATTAADGSFTMQVPSTPQGLPIRLEVDEFAANQDLILPTIGGIPVWGVQTVRTMFGPFISATAVPALGLASGQVQSAYVEFSDPTGTPAAQPTTKATAAAVLTSSGIVSINISNPGEGYTQPPVVKIPKGTAFNSVQAEGTAVISNGMITGVTITNAGSGYKPGDTPALSFVGSDSIKAQFTPQFTYSVENIIFNPGTGYGQTAPAVTIVGAGTGATAHAVMGGDLKTVDITAMGSGYTQAPTVLISDNFKAYDGATANMTTNNPIFSIDYKGTMDTSLWATTPGVRIVAPGGGGTGATASVTLKSTGKIASISGLVGGTGYTSAPIITFTGGGGFGASATANVVGGVVTGINLIDGGQGYTTAPTISFTGGGGSGAAATANIGFPVQSITLVAAGAGYADPGLDSIAVFSATKRVNFLAQSVVKYNKGVRSLTLSNTAGFYYSTVPTVTFTPKDGNGTGAAATASLNWQIIDIVVDTPGSGYKWNTEITTVIVAPPGGAGTQATATARLGNGVLASVGLVSQGEGYTAPPHAYLNILTSPTPAGVIPVKQAMLTATLTGDNVTGLTIDDPGEGYDLASDMAGKYVIEITTYNTSAAATAQANPESGQIAFIEVTNPGAGYSIVPSVEISYTTLNADSLRNANGFGSGAMATAVVIDGRVSAITIDDAGSGYYTVPQVNVSVVSSVMKAVGRCNVSGDGRILDVVFTGGAPFTAGFGYDAAPTMTFTPSVTGMGSGAEGTAIIENGSVKNVVMTNQGSGYLGKNYPAATGFGIKPVGNVWAIAGKSYIRDLYFGTGMRTVQ